MKHCSNHVQGRLEGIRCALLVEEQRERERNLQRDSGFVSCSLEAVERHTPHSQVPVAPPRRRRKSTSDAYRKSLNEPIYAVVDFSKKINRRSLLAAPKASQEEDTETEYEPIEDKTDVLSQLPVENKCFEIDEESE